METRKVQFTGNSTFTISLPRDWIEKMGIRKGDTLGIMRDKRGLITVSPATDLRAEDRVKTIDVLKEPPAHIERMLIGAYIMGFDTIVVRFRDRLDNVVRERIRQFTRIVTGVEIIEETANTIVIKDLTDPAELSQEKGVRRLHLIVPSMHSDVMISLQKKDQSLAEDVINRDSDADRIYWLIMKEHNVLAKNFMMAEKLQISPEESSSYFQMVRYLERIGDHAVQIARSVILLKDYSVPKDIMAHLKSAHEHAIRMMDDAVGAFFKRGVSEANQVIDRRDSLNNSLGVISADIRKVRSDEAVHLALIEESIRRVAYYATDISEITINYCMLADQ